MRKVQIALGLMLVAGAAQGQTYGWSGSILELDCRGAESVGGNVAKERACMELAADVAIGGDLVCNGPKRDAGLCPANRTIAAKFPRVRLQDCTDQDIPGDRGRCRYGRGPDTFDNSTCTARDQPVTCCTGLGTGTCPERPTCDAAEWGHITRNLNTGDDSVCKGSWQAVVDEEPEQWHPALFEGAFRTTVGALPTCDADYEGVAMIVTNGGADCATTGAGEFRCRCLSATWTKEVKEYQIFPPSGTLPSSPSIAGLPPCNASTDNLRAWVGPYPDYPDAPWIEGTLYRCQNPTWAANVGNYRLGEAEDGLGDVIRPWCRDGKLGNLENCWVPAPPDHPTAWIEDQGRDLLLRWQKSRGSNRRAAGQKKILEGIGPPEETD